MKREKERALLVTMAEFAWHSTEPGIERLGRYIHHFGHRPDGKCHWPKKKRCTRPAGGERVTDGDAFFCSRHCPICGQ